MQTLEQLRRQDLPPNFWKGAKRDFAIGREEFRVTGIRGDGRRIRLDDIVTSINWEDTGLYMTGTLSCVRPAHRKGKVGIGVGNLVQVHASPWGQQRWRPVFRMRVQSVSKSIVDGSLDFELADDMVLFSRSRMDFKYKRRSKGPHRRGWKAHQITRDVLRRTGVHRGRLYKGKAWIKNHVYENASPLDVVMAAYRKERQKTGTKFVIRMGTTGALTVRPLQYSPWLYEIGPLLIQATLTQQMRGDIATVLNVRATGGKKKGKHKIRLTVRSHALINRYGKIVRNITVDADSKAEARKEARRILAKRTTPKREVTFTHPGIWRLRRGHALRLYLPHENLKQVVFVKEIRHSVTSGDFTSEVTVRFDDPYEDKRDAEDREKRCEKAESTDRKSDDCKDKRRARARPKRNEKRREAIIVG